MKLAVLGGGNGSYAAAADLAAGGHDVRLWRRDGAALQVAIDAGGIVLKDASGSQKVPVSLLTSEIGAAVRGVRLIVMPTPATAQLDIAAQLAPHLVDDQVVFLPPGTFGSYVMAQRVNKLGNRARVMWAETGTLPYLARKHGAAEVNITMRAIHLPTGVYPSRREAEALEVIQQAYPAVHGCGNALSGALMNAGPVIHPPLMVMNAAPLQHFASWDIHNEGTQPAVRAVTDRLDRERIAVREAFGFGAPHYPLADHYNNDKWMYGDAHKRLVDSGDWREHIDLLHHRYITEDTEMGLAFLASAARVAGVRVPIADGLLAIVGAFLGRDLASGERTLRALGLADRSVDELNRLLD